MTTSAHGTDVMLMAEGLPLIPHDIQFEDINNRASQAFNVSVWLSVHTFHSWGC